jgi:hypothetical protein
MNIIDKKSPKPSAEGLIFHPDLLKVMRYGQNRCPNCCSMLDITKFAFLTCAQCPEQVEIYRDSGTCDYLDFYLQISNSQVVVDSGIKIKKIHFHVTSSGPYMSLPLNCLDFNNLDGLREKIKLYMTFS